MQFLCVLSVVGVAALAGSQRVSGPEIVAVRRVVDGNTIEVANYGRVRLAGIRAPRAGRRGVDAEPFGRQAHDRLEGLTTHRFVRLEFTAAGSSSAYVLLEDGTCVNAMLVADGLARVSGHPSGPRGDELVRAQVRAQAAHLGIWGAE